MKRKALLIPLALAGALAVSGCGPAALLGGVGGGLAGAHIGAGAGHVAATAAGVAAGMAIGNEIDKAAE